MSSSYAHRVLSAVAVMVAMALALPVQAQSFTDTNGMTPTNVPWVDLGHGPEALAGGVPVVLTHSASMTPVAGSVSCNAGGLHTDNSYWRAFDLNAFGVVGPLEINSVDIAVEQATGATGSQPIELRLYTSASAFPSGFPGSLTPIGTVATTVPDGSLVPFTFPVAGVTAPAGSQLVVEIFTPNGQTTGNSFFIGSNAAGQTGPSYLSAADCGVTNPTDVAAIGFPNMHIIMAVNGDDLVPVELTSFGATTSGTSVNLNWETASETNNAGFEVQIDRGTGFEAVSFVDGHGTTTEAQTYGHTVTDLAPGTYAFRLKQIDFDGAFEYSGEVEATIEVVGTHVLTDAYPNPFNPQATFTFAASQAQAVTATLYNALGQRVAVLFDGSVEADQTQTVSINGAGLSSGLYVVRVEGERFSDALRVTLLK